MKQHIFPGYNEISTRLEYASQRDIHFSAAYCQRLLETIESYAIEAQDAPHLRALCREMVAHLRGLPYSKKWSAEHEARQALLERAEVVLKGGCEGVVVETQQRKNV